MYVFTYNLQLYIKLFYYIMILIISIKIVLIFNEKKL